jgi:flagellar biogenesis protein FliO
MRFIVSGFIMLLLAYQPGLGFGFFDAAVNSPTAAAVDSSTDGTPAAAESLALAPDFPLTQSLGGVGIVLSLIVAGFFGTRKFAPTIFRRPSPEKTLRVIETLSIGDRRSIAVIQVDDKRFLIGNTAHQISLLAPLSASLALQVEPRETAVDSAPVKSGEGTGKFRNLYEIEKGGTGRRATGPRTIPPDIRAKMRQLRETLEQ